MTHQKINYKVLQHLLINQYFGHLLLSRRAGTAYPSGAPEFTPGF
jgi:hypothetical protein